MNLPKWFTTYRTLRKWSEEEHQMIYPCSEKLEAALEIALEALYWIDKPDHFEPDNYTQVACFQHRANEAIKKINKIGETDENKSV